MSSRSPSQASSSAAWSGFVSWYSSTENQRYRSRTSAAIEASVSSNSTVRASMSSKSIAPARSFAASYRPYSPAMRSAGSGAARPWADAAVAYDPAGIRRAFAHSISDARSRTPRYRYPPGSVRASGVSSPTFESRMRGNSDPATRGQKCRSCRRAAAWKVIAETPRCPTAASRARISVAALSVKVTTSTSTGRTASVASAYATRRLITRVLPDPAPARMASGPRTVVTASRWASSRSASRASGSGSAIGPIVAGPAPSPRIGDPRTTSDPVHACHAPSCQAGYPVYDAGHVAPVVPAAPIEGGQRMTAPASVRPTGVTILAALAAIGGVLGLLGGVAIMGLGGVAAGATGNAAYSGIGGLVGILSIVLAVANIAFAYGAWSLQPS